MTAVSEIIREERRTLEYAMGMILFKDQWVSYTIETEPKKKDVDKTAEIFKPKDFSDTEALELLQKLFDHYGINKQVSKVEYRKSVYFKQKS